MFALKLTFNVCVYYRVQNVTVFSDMEFHPPLKEEVP